MNLREDAAAEIRKVYNSRLYLADSALDKILDAVEAVYTPVITDLVLAVRVYSGIKESWTLDKDETDGLVRALATVLEGGLNG